MCSDRIGGAFGTHFLRLIGCLAALFVASDSGAVTFQDAVSFAVGDRPFSVAVADLDGDDILDLVSANLGSDSVSVLLGNGNGTFQDATPFVVGGAPRSVAVADINGDSRPDLVTANDLSGDVSVLISLHRRLPAMSMLAMAVLASALALLGTCFGPAR
jgi:hypothetical protein